MQARAALLLGITLSTTAMAATDPPEATRDMLPGDMLPSDLPGSTLPIVREHTYKMAGRVRALLLWIGRDDVGSGLIRWRKGGDGIAYDLLIGSDPVRAPGKLNRWGFLAEEVQGSECSVLGVMSKSTEGGLSEVKKGLTDAAGGRPFDTIRGKVTTHQAFARVATVQASSSLTYREADAVLGLALGTGSDAIKQIARPNGVRPGFLSSVAEVMHGSVSGEGRTASSAARTIPYVYGDRVYELKVLETTPLARFEYGGRTYDNVIRGRFETGRAGTRGSRFELVYGTAGAFAEIPILISYQPKWWLHVELVIES